MSIANKIKKFFGKNKGKEKKKEKDFSYEDVQNHLNTFRNISNTYYEFEVPYNFIDGEKNKLLEDIKDELEFKIKPKNYEDLKTKTFAKYKQFEDKEEVLNRLQLDVYTVYRNKQNEEKLGDMPFRRVRISYTAEKINGSPYYVFKQNADKTKFEQENKKSLKNVYNIESKLMDSSKSSE